MVGSVRMSSTFYFVLLANVQVSFSCFRKQIKKYLSKTAQTKNSYLWCWAQVDPSFVISVEESSSKQVTKNKDHFPHDIFGKFACSIKLEKSCYWI